MDKRFMQSLALVSFYGALIGCAIVGLWLSGGR